MNIVITAKFFLTAKTCHKKLAIGLSHLNNQKGYKVLETEDKFCIAVHDQQSYEREYIIGTALVIDKIQYKKMGETTTEGNGITNTY